MLWINQWITNFHENYFKLVRKFGLDILLLAVRRQVLHCVKSVQIWSFFWSVFCRVMAIFNMSHNVWRPASLLLPKLKTMMGQY